MCQIAPSAYYVNSERRQLKGTKKSLLFLADRGFDGLRRVWYDCHHVVHSGQTADSLASVLATGDRGVRRKGVTRPNLVAAAVRLAGGPSAVAAICGVARQTIYDWIGERRVERLIDALRLSRASGVPIENLAGDDVEKLAAPVTAPSAGRRRRTVPPGTAGL